MISVGVDYYPEHWPEEIWESDIKRMKDAGIKVVRIGEFAWSRLEPEEGVYDFKWLDRIVNLLSANGMKIIIGTPTNCPPEWLYINHPECLSHNSSGLRTHTGVRGHRCLSSEVYRGFVKDIVSRLSKRYALNSAVLAWQIDNEVEDSHCTCDSCIKSFRKYLSKKYKSIEEVNKTWGTDVWSIDHQGFDTIEIPKTIPDNFSMGWFNPAYILDYERYCSSMATDYVDFQAKIIRSYNPDAVITTNSCFCGPIQNFYEEFEKLDIASYDNYPAAEIPSDPSAESYSNAFILDMIRSYKQKNYWIMEQLGGNGGCWGGMGRAIRPGQLKGYAMQAAAHGGDLISFFRWRSALTGAEMINRGILDHDNRDNARLEELKEFASDLYSLDGLDGTETESRAAILYSPDQQYVFSTQAQQPGFTYWNEMQSIHDACMNLGVNVDFVSDSQIKGGYINNGKEDRLETVDLSRYSILFVSSYSVCDDTVLEKINEFVRSGGTAVITTRSGEKDVNGNYRLGNVLPGPFSEMCGLTIRDQDPIGAEKSTVTFNDGSRYEITSWCDVLEPSSDTETIARYDDFFYSGTSAFTRHRYGAGHAYYLGTVGDKNFYRRITADLCREAGIEIQENLPWGLEYCSRTAKNPDRKFAFLFNNTDKKQKAVIDGKEILLKPFEYQIFR